MLIHLFFIEVRLVLYFTFENLSRRAFLRNVPEVVLALCLLHLELFEYIVDCLWWGVRLPQIGVIVCLAELVVEGAKAS